MNSITLAQVVVLVFGVAAILTLLGLVFYRVFKALTNTHSQNGVGDTINRTIEPPRDIESVRREISLSLKNLHVVMTGMTARVARLNLEPDDHVRIKLSYTSQWEALYEVRNDFVHYKTLEELEQVLARCNKLTQELAAFSDRVAKLEGVSKRSLADSFPSQPRVRRLRAIDEDDSSKLVSENK